MTDEIIQDEIAAALMPLAWPEFVRVRDSGNRFVHYTRAEAAFNILKSKCIWMRNATCMNDFNEMKHGINCLIHAFSGDVGKRFNEALEGCFPGLAGEIDTRFTNAAPALLEHTYITSVSEHSDDEEAYGRLSMWQSYGSDTSVALVFNNGPFLRDSNAIPIYLTPVAYINSNGFAELINQIAINIEEKKELFGKISREDFAEWIFRALIFAVVSSKHEGFREEKEWRIVHLPTLWPANPERLPLDQVCLAGVPQPIFKIPFVDYIEEGFYGVTLPDLISRIIVGPTQYPEPIRMAFAQLLVAAGTENAFERIHCSDITLRVRG